MSERDVDEAIARIRKKLNTRVNGQEAAPRPSEMRRIFADDVLAVAQTQDTTLFIAAQNNDELLAAKLRLLDIDSGQNAGNGERLELSHANASRLREIRAGRETREKVASPVVLHADDLVHAEYTAAILSELGHEGHSVKPTRNGHAVHIPDAPDNLVGQIPGVVRTARERANASPKRGWQEATVKSRGPGETER